MPGRKEPAAARAAGPRPLMDDVAPAALAEDLQDTGDTSLPLVVDLDGSLVRGDTTLACVISLAGRPLSLLSAALAWRHGRAAAKQVLAAAADLGPERLPYNAELLAYLRAQHDAGRLLILA